MNKKKRNLYFMVLFVAAILIGIGYAILTSNLNIAGSTSINNNTWDIHFENLKVTTGSVEASTPTISNGTNITYTVTLDKPKDYYEFTVDASNKGSIDAMIKSVSTTGLTATQKKYLTYSATYDSGKAIEEKQELKKNTSEKIRVLVKFKDEIEASDLPNGDQTLNLSLNIEYEQKGDNSVAVEHPTCKRATYLHKETCTNTFVYACAGSGSLNASGGGFSTGDTITYGNYGTAGSLTSGDAFDCDVNGDKEYNPETERFYYVSELDTNNNYGVLIYYNSVSGGEPNNTTGYAYDSLDRVGKNGPVTLLPQLPSTTQWKNVSLSNQTRKIKSETGTEYIDFTYTGRAARLLTTQEVENACNITVESSNLGKLDTCKYLLENTGYSNNSLTNFWWLENPRGYTVVWVVGGSSRFVRSVFAYEDSHGVRPAIEVPKSKISY